MLRVLVVEDDIEKQADISRVLIAAGIPEKYIDLKNNVKCALALLKLNIYNLVILDLCLPLKDAGSRIAKTRNDAGITILQEIASGIYNTPQQIIGLTGYENLQNEYAEQFKKLNFYLYKYDLSGEWQESLIASLKWLEKGLRNRERQPTQKLVVTVHGIRTRGKWQEKLKDALARRENVSNCSPYKYPYFSFLKLFSRSKGNAVDLFKSDLRELFQEHPNSEVYIFAHSFGTYLVYEGLREMTLSECPNINSIVFAGSVLRADSKIANLANSLNVDLVVNDCGRRDIPLLLSECFLKGLGMAGVTGFYGFSSDRFIQRKFNGGHSFFEKDKEFYSKYWLPILDNQVITDDAEFCTAEGIKGTATYFLYNIKYFVWFFIILLFVYCIY